MYEGRYDGKYDHRPPTLTVVTPVGGADDRRLTTADLVTAALRLTTGTDTALINNIIDAVSDECARYCGLAVDSTGTLPTFGSEVLTAIWLTTFWNRTERLILPWRQPITAVSSVVEDGITLDTTDYNIIAGGMIERVSDDTPIVWSSGKIVVSFTAGFDLPDNAPPGLARQVIEQVKMRYLNTSQDPSIRSETLVDVYQGSYSVAGGDSIGKSGLLYSLENALTPYKNWGV